MRRKSIPLFYFLPIIILIQSLMVGGILLLFWGCLIVGLCYSDIIEIYLFLVFAVYIILLPFELFFHQDIRKIHHDIKKNNFIEADVVLEKSSSLSKRRCNLLNFTLNHFFYMELASFQKCTCRSLYDESQSENYFIFILNEVNLRLLQKIFFIKIRYWDAVHYPKTLIFQNNIPLRVIYGAESHVLLKVAPIPHYEYTEEQKALIFRFDAQLHEKNNFKKRPLNSNTFIKLTKGIPFWFFIAVVIIVFFVVSFAIYIYSWYLTVYPEAEIMHFIRNRFIVDIVLIAIPFIALMIQSDKTFSFLWLIKKKSLTYCAVDIVSGISTSTLSHDGFRNILRIIFPGKNPILQKICFTICEKNNDSKSIVLYYTLTNEKYDLLSTLFKCSVSSICVKNRHGSLSQFRFQNGVPLRITYTKEDSMLREIHPVENYPYTEGQLAAIEKLNTLYP